MTDSFVGLRKAFEGQPTPVDLREAEEDVPADVHLELSVDFTDELQGALCVPFKKQRGKSPSKRESKKRKTGDSSSQVVQSEPLPARKKRKKTVGVEIPIARTRSQTRQSREASVEPEVSVGRTSSSKGATPSPGQRRGRVSTEESSRVKPLPEETRATGPISIGRAAGIPKSPFKTVAKRRILKSIIVQEKRAASPAPIFDLRLLRQEPSHVNISALVATESQPSTTGVDKTFEALVADGLVSPSASGGIMEASVPGAEASETPIPPIINTPEVVPQDKPSEAEVIEALTDLDYGDARIEEDLAEMVQDDEKTEGDGDDELRSSSEDSSQGAENSDVDITGNKSSSSDGDDDAGDDDAGKGSKVLTGAELLEAEPGETQNIVPPSVGEIQAEPVTAEAGKTITPSGAVSGHVEPDAGGSRISGGSEAEAAT